MNNTIKPIRSEADHKEALKRIETLWGSPIGTPEGDELEVLIVLVHEYERENIKLGPLDPVEVIRAKMEGLGLKQVDLCEAIGQPSAVSEILARKRHLTVDQIRSLSDLLGVEPALLIGPSTREAWKHLEELVRIHVAAADDALDVLRRNKGDGQLIVYREGGTCLLFVGDPKKEIVAKSPAAARSIADAFDTFVHTFPYPKAHRGTTRFGPPGSPGSKIANS